MKKNIQNFFLYGYLIIRENKFFSTDLGKKLMAIIYSFYKNIYEINIEYCKNYIEQDSIIIDIGANVGFYSKKFSKWVSGKGYVVALEPEKNNFQQLVNLSKRIKKIHPFMLAAGNEDKSLFLKINSKNPADHRISDNGIRVDGVKIDTIMAKFGWPRVSFIKIDVQGYELNVLKGAKITIAKFKPILMLEIDYDALKSSKCDPNELIDWILNINYEMFKIGQKNIESRITKQEALNIVSKSGYADFIFKKSECIKIN